MAAEKMERSTADNEYLHKDFHNALNIGIEYLRTQYSPQAVIEYLSIFTRRFYGPLIERVKLDGLHVLADFFTDLYATEKAGGDISIHSKTDGSLTLDVTRCPAVSYMADNNLPVYPMFKETSLTVYRVLAESAGYSYRCEFYEAETGASRHIFRKESL